MVNRASDFMSKDIPQLGDSTTLREATSYLIRNGIDVCIVIGANKRIVGVLGAVDIIRRRHEPNFDDLTLRDIVATLRSMTLSPEDFMEDAAEIVVNYHNIDYIVIENRGQPEGIISKVDILKWLESQWRKS